MGDSTMDGIKSGKGLEPLQGNDTSNSGITTERRTEEGYKTERSYSGIRQGSCLHYNNK